MSAEITRMKDTNTTSLYLKSISIKSRVIHSNRHDVKTPPAERSAWLKSMNSFQTFRHIPVKTINHLETVRKFHLNITTHSTHENRQIFRQFGDTANMIPMIVSNQQGTLGYIAIR